MGGFGVREFHQQVAELAAEYALMELELGRRDPAARAALSELVE
jgi:hypothetical protein